MPHTSLLRSTTSQNISSDFSEVVTKTFGGCLGEMPKDTVPEPAAVWSEAWTTKVAARHKIKAGAPLPVSRVEF